MRDKIIAVIILIILLGFVGTNTVILDNLSESLLKDVDNLNFKNIDSKDEAELIWNKFQRYETYISLTVSHSDLSSVEDCFCEMIGALNTGDTNSAETAKYRLKNALEHLRRLSGINLDAII